MTEQQPEDAGVIEPSRAGAHEERRDMEVIEPLRPPARDLHETWREDATKTPGQIVAEEGVDHKEATRRVRWARRQQKRMDELGALVEELNAKRLARKTSAGQPPALGTKNDSKGVNS